jgi:predicted N-acyltransferase
MGSPYPTRKFFQPDQHSMSKHILLIFARREGALLRGPNYWVGGALWSQLGVREHHDFCILTCYYQAIDFAIQHRLSRVEAGAQGSINWRGVPRKDLACTISPIRDGASVENMEQERRAIDQDLAKLAQHSPFRHEQDD